uniref:Transposase n=1 Tax=Romanomermis culicivorax TaxID=13658 RepID=A0A915KVP4_ROMCU
MSALSQSGKKSTSRPRISDQLKIRILEEYKQLGWKPTQIAKNVNERGYACHSTTILRLLQKYEKTGSLSNLGGQGKKSTISFYVLEIIQRTLDENAETTTTEMQKVLDDHGYSLHLRTIVRARRKLGEAN